MIRIGMRGHDLPGSSLPEVAEACRRLGVQNIQLALTKSVLNIEWKPGVFSPGLATEFRRTLENAGVHVSVLGCYINPVHPETAAEGLALFREHIKFAKYLGADMIGLESCAPSRNREETRSEASYQRLVTNMRPVIGEAEKLSVMVGIEAVHCHVLYNPQRMRRFLDEIDSPNLCVIFDPVNLIDVSNYERQQAVFEESFQLFGDRIAVIHLKDFAVENRKLVGRKAGEGMLDLECVFRLAKRDKPGIEMITEELNESNFTRIRAALAARYESC